MEDEKVIQMKEEIKTWKTEYYKLVDECSELVDCRRHIDAYHTRQLKDSLVLDKEVHEMIKKLERCIRLSYVNRFKNLRTIRKRIELNELKIDILTG